MNHLQNLRGIAKAWFQLHPFWANGALDRIAWYGYLTSFTVLMVFFAYCHSGSKRSMSQNLVSVAEMRPQSKLDVQQKLTDDVEDLKDQNGDEKGRIHSLETLQGDNDHRLTRLESKVDSIVESNDQIKQSQDAILWKLLIPLLLTGGYVHWRTRPYNILKKKDDNDD